MATNKRQTGVRFEPALLYKLTFVAKQNKRSLNAQLEYLAELCVKEYEKENGEIAVDENVIYTKKGSLYTREAKQNFHNIYKIDLTTAILYDTMKM